VVVEVVVVAAVVVAAGVVAAVFATVIVAVVVAHYMRCVVHHGQNKGVACVLAPRRAYLDPPGH
jgi:hypothetical protein